MKATIIIIAAVLSLQASVLFAKNNETSPITKNEAVHFNMNVLAPVTPGEATFEDATESIGYDFNFSDLAPVTPFEADFPDVVSENIIDITILAPVAPTEADFNDTEVLVNDFSALAPVTPAEADFE